MAGAAPPAPMAESLIGPVSAQPARREKTARKKRESMIFISCSVVGYEWLVALESVPEWIIRPVSRRVSLTCSMALLGFIFSRFAARAANHFDTRSTSPDLTWCRQDTSFGVVLVVECQIGSHSFHCFWSNDPPRRTGTTTGNGPWSFARRLQIDTVLQVASPANRRRSRETIRHERKA